MPNTDPKVDDKPEITNPDTGALDGTGQAPSPDKVAKQLSTTTINDLLAANPALPNNAQLLQKALRELNPTDVLNSLASAGNAKSMSEYKFWSTQPVPSFDEPAPSSLGAGPSSGSSVAASKPFKEGPIQVKDKSQVSTTPAALIDGFEWSEMDLMNDAVLEEVRDLLCHHYVEDKEEMFRFDYATSTLNWALKAPGWRSKWHVGVRTASSKKLVAFISAIPMKLRVRDNTFDGAEVNFICVHKKLRSKRLAPVLITEITRRCNVEGIFQAIYTAGVLLPRPVSICRYYHRSLDWEKLYSIGFSSLPANSSRARQVAKYKLPEKTQIKGLRLMEKKDVAAVTRLVTSYLDRMSLAQVFDETEVVHWLLDNESSAESPNRAVWTYVVETDGKVTDFFSYYRLNSTVVKKTGGQDTVRVAYMFYYGTDAADVKQENNAVLKARLNELIKDALILAKQAKFDVFNAVTVLDNSLFFQEQKFEPGDGRLHYYLYNYRTQDIANGLNAQERADPNNVGGIGVVML